MERAKDERGPGPSGAHGAHLPREALQVGPVKRILLDPFGSFLLLARSKSIKFVLRPTIEQLPLGWRLAVLSHCCRVRELNMLCESLREIVQHDDVRGPSVAASGQDLDMHFCTETFADAFP